MKDSIVKDKSFRFALKIINLYKTLQKKREFIISKQILRSGTGIGANIPEALAGESKADFIHKMSIASKEARETLYWLELLHRNQIVSFDYQEYVRDCIEIVKILTKIIKTSQNLKLKTKN